jgi:lipopolysaccharide biosynthesis glycosyltransferase
MPPSPLHLVSALDSRFYPGLLTSLCTALHCASGRYDYRVTVLDGGLADEQWEKLHTRLLGIGRLRGITVHPRRLIPGINDLASLPTRRGSSLTYARLRIPHLLNDDFLVYMDSDIVCFRGIEDFWDNLTDDVAVTAALDPLKKTRHGRTVRERLPGDLNAPYFNAGIIGINGKMWRQAEISEQMSELIGQAQDFHYVDQSLLNIVFYKQWTEVPALNNHVLTLEHCAGILELNALANLHYIGSRKPWLNATSSFYRIIPDCLFDHLYAFHKKTGSKPDRQIKALSIRKAQRKAWLYTLIAPARANIYKNALRAAKIHSETVGTLLRRFCPDITDHPPILETRYLS